MPKKPVGVLGSKENSIPQRQQKAVKIHPYTCRKDSVHQVHEQRTSSSTPCSEIPKHSNTNVSHERVATVLKKETLDQPQPGNSEGALSQDISGSATFQQVSAKDSEESASKASYCHPKTVDESSLMNQDIASTGNQATVRNNKKPIMPADVPPPKKNVGRQDLQLVGNSLHQYQPKQSKFHLSAQHLGPSQMQGRNSSFHRIQQNKNEKIQEILERINQTCAVQKQHASQLQTLLTDQNQMQDRYSTGYLPRTYSYDNKENENPQIGYLAGLQSSQQFEQQICKNLSQWKTIERIQSGNQFHNLNQFQNSPIVTQHNRDINQQHTPQSGQQGNLTNLPDKPGLPLYMQIRTARIQQVQHIITTQEGQKIVQHPHVFAPVVHSPIVLPCSISAPPFIAASSAATVPLQVETFSDMMCIVPHTNPAFQGQMYSNSHDEHEARFPEHSGAKLNNLLLATVNAVSLPINIYPDIYSLEYRSQEMQVDILPRENVLPEQDNSQAQQIQVVSVDSSSDSDIDIEFSDSFNMHNMGESNSRRCLAIELNSPVCNIPESRQNPDLQQSLPVDHSNLDTSNSVSQQLSINIAESDQTDESQRGSINQGQIIGENLSHSGPSLESNNNIPKDTANFRASSPIIQQSEFKEAIPDERLELQSGITCKQGVLPENSHSASEKSLAKVGSMTEEVVVVAKHDSGMSLTTKSEDGVEV
ncbi:uncharacterized protein [Palaemon carinicauda]|uniref:uncharacterized protein n=1 Tax=Palaemon carinicauda TaxID=392227 RepID=UPI0035B670B1